MLRAKPASVEQRLAQLSESHGRIEGSQQRMEAQLRSIADFLMSERGWPEAERDRRRSLCTIQPQVSTTFSDAEAPSSPAPSPRPRAALLSARSGPLCLAEDFDARGTPPGGREDEVAPMLPKGWPRLLEARHTDTECGSVANSIEVEQMMNVSGRQRVSIYEKLREDSGRQTKALRARILGRTKVVMEVAGFFFIMYDLVVTPYFLAWDTEIEASLQAVMFAAAAFWTVDMVTSLLGWSDSDGGEDEQPKNAVSKYLHSWFWLDCPLVVSDWATIIFAQLAGEDTGRMVKVARLARATKSLKMIAFIKMLRAVKLSRYWAEVIDRSLSEKSRVGLRLIAMFGCLVWMNHIVACLWYVLGTLGPSDTEHRWTLVDVELGDSLVHFDESPMGYQYATAYHWAVAQTTLGASEVMPKNSIERFFSILCLLVALICGSSLVSTLSAVMVDIQMSQHERTKHLRLLRRFLRENKVSRGVAVKVQRQAMRRLKAQTSLTPGDVSAIGVVSESLQKHLHREICEPKLVMHPFFRTLRNVATAWFEDFCHSVVLIDVARGDDDIFFAARPAKAAYYITRGSVTYTQEPMSAPVTERTSQTVEDHTWLSEAALWVQWVHVGAARARCTCELLCLEAERFVASFKGHRVVSKLAAEYGQLFHSRVVEARPPLGWYPTDLETPFAEFADIVSAMSLGGRESVAYIASQGVRSTGALATFLGQNHAPAGIVNDIIEEVSAGSVVLVPKSTGELETVQHCVAYSIEDDDGHLFVQLGVWTGVRAKAKCQLPSIERAEQEDIVDCYERLTARLQPLSGGLSFRRVDRCVERLGSIGVERRRVVRKIHAEFFGEVSAPVCLARTGKGGGPGVFRRGGRLRPSALDSADRFMDQPVFYIENEPGTQEDQDEDQGEEEEGIFYTWLSCDDFERLRGAGEGELVVWLSHLSPPKPPPDDVCEKWTKDSVSV